MVENLRSCILVSVNDPNSLPEYDEQINNLVRDLPDAEGARLFFDRFAMEQPRIAAKLVRDKGLLADVLALAAWSPLLATTLVQHPEYLTWLAREREVTRVRRREEFGEALARFAATNSQLPPPLLVARFRRRELLRIYLHDIRKTNTLVEVTEELSNLADAVLEYALTLARQEMDNRYGAPQCVDERNRTAVAGFSIIALGKLGSRELNYASDIDLLFLYSDDGTTSGAGTRGATTNREYFVKLAETVMRIVGQIGGEGAAYRVDVRLRPYGRDGALACSLDEAVRYYRATAQAWERQALIRARSAAGSHALYARFLGQVRAQVYAPDVTIAHALADVRLAKQKIDRHHARDSQGFNVKLGSGGIREIEFIAQALQLAFGGRDEWLHAPHTLISLSRLADRNLITEHELTELADAYTFLRTLEHRLQMEHGLQTHTVPDEPARRTLVARRMMFAGHNALANFNRALDAHTRHVRAAFQRIFGTGAEPSDVEEKVNGEEAFPMRHKVVISQSAAIEQTLSAETTALQNAAVVFATHLADEAVGAASLNRQSNILVEDLARAINGAAQESLNPRRALRLINRIASSLDKFALPVTITKVQLKELVRLCGTSEFFGEMIASNPALIASVPTNDVGHVAQTNYHAALLSAIEGEVNFGAQLSALRRAWSKLFVEIGALDGAGAITMREANHRQTALAAASLDAGYHIAVRELARRYATSNPFAAQPLPISVLGLGRLGGGGMDYGSDLDVILVYDDSLPSPIANLESTEVYARVVELLVTALSSLTREGFLYRVDLRLRPDGRNGATCSGASAFLGYLRERARVWEWLAYVKLRAAAGDLDFGERIEREARRIIHEAAERLGQNGGADADSLRIETRRVRERLEREKIKHRTSDTIDIKFGAGGMLDVYFATRYLQLRDNVPDDEADRSTGRTLARLRATNSLDEADYGTLQEGYAYLRTLDHYLRLIVGRSTLLPAADHPALSDIARRMAYTSTGALLEHLNAHMKHIRTAYDRITMKEG